MKGAMTSYSGSWVTVTFVSARDMGREAAKLWRRICRGDRSIRDSERAFESCDGSDESVVPSPGSPLGVYVPLTPFDCCPCCPLGSGVVPFFPTECRELVRTGVSGRSALRFCGMRERGGALSTLSCCCEDSAAGMTSNFAATSRSGWNSWYGRSSRGLSEWLDRGTLPDRKWPDSSRANEPGLLLCRPDRLPGFRGAMADAERELECRRPWLYRSAC